MSASTERRRILRLPRQQSYAEQVASIKALTRELTDSLVTHFTGPYMDRAHRLGEELSDPTVPTSDNDFVSAVGESGSVAMVLKEKFETVVDEFYQLLTEFETVSASKDGDVRVARQNLIDSANLTSARLRRAFSAIIKHDDLLRETTPPGELLGEGKQRVATWYQDVIKIVHSGHTLRR